MNHATNPAARTISMQTVQYEDGSWGVTVYVTGLASEREAEVAQEHIAGLLCGDEIKAQG